MTDRLNRFLTWLWAVMGLGLLMPKLSDGYSWWSPSLWTAICWFVALMGLFLIFARKPRDPSRRTS